VANNVNAPPEDAAVIGKRFAEGPVATTWPARWGITYGRTNVGVSSTRSEGAREDNGDAEMSESKEEAIASDHILFYSTKGIFF
jgi:hypothetical protein